MDRINKENGFTEELIVKADTLKGLKIRDIIEVQNCYLQCGLLGILRKGYLEMWMSMQSKSGVFGGFKKNRGFKKVYVVSVAYK